MRSLLRIAALAFALLCAGCGAFASLADLDARDARMTNNVAAMTLETTITVAELLFEAEQRLAIAAALKEDGVTKTIIRERLKEVRARWVPVWKAVDETRALQSRLAAALEQGGALAAAATAIEFAASEANLSEAVATARRRVLKEKR